MTMPVIGGFGMPVTGCGGSTMPTMGLGVMTPRIGCGLITTPMTGFGLMITPRIGLAEAPLGAKAAAPKAAAVARVRSEVRVDIGEPLLDRGGSTHPQVGRRLSAVGSAGAP